MKRFVVGALTMLLLEHAPSSSSGTKQPEDEFLDQVETACRDAGKTIRKLVEGEDGATSDLYDTVSDMADGLNDLEVPDGVSSDVKRDFGAFTASVDDEVSRLEQLNKDVSAEVRDEASVSASVLALNTARAENDALVNKLQIYSCLGVVPQGGLAVVVTDTTTDPTVPATDPTTTTVFTIPEPTTTDAPDTTVPTASTTEAGDRLPGDLAIDGIAPAGYTWVAYDPPDVQGLYDNAVIGDLVTYYSGGKLESIADGSTVTVYVVRLSEAFTDAYTKAYQFWEAVENGTDVASPGGLTVHQELGAFTNTDCGVYISGDRGVAICTYTGYDGLSLMDAWVAANP